MAYVSKSVRWRWQYFSIDLAIGSEGDCVHENELNGQHVSRQTSA